MWSAGYVLAELLLGQPLFPRESGVDQLVEIIKIWGTPTREGIRCMNLNYTEFKFPQIKAHPWHKRTPGEAVDLVLRLLQYSPNLRCTTLYAFCMSPHLQWILVTKLGMLDGFRWMSFNVCFVHFWCYQRNLTVLSFTCHFMYGNITLHVDISHVIAGGDTLSKLSSYIITKKNKKIKKKRE
ncbi:hypothetical protein HYC85_019642 [Camellia sinensis]|uniref:Protein kinase domain-containing protein n=1 Tax=Camellia sinensis TaxID=4442 RepID=A0A7J7GMR4_CAMSI|nr:hypothetical protein HYC85_019642 [Camellia sinensis]